MRHDTTFDEKIKNMTKSQLMHELIFSYIESTHENKTLDEQLLCDSIKIDAHVFEPNTKGQMILCFCAERGYTSAVSTLAALGADMNTQDSDYQEKGSALIRAVLNNDLDTVKVLLNHGADIEHEYEKNNCTTTALIESLTLSEPNITKYLQHFINSKKEAALLQSSIDYKNNKDDTKNKPSSLKI